MRRLAILSGLVFCVSLLAHVLSFSRSPFISMSLAWPIHAAIFIPCGCMVLVLQSYGPKLEASENEGFLNRIRSAGRCNREFQRNVMQLCPHWVRVLTVMLAVYCGINFFLFTQLLPDGTPVKDNGRFVLQNHGTVVRSLTELEYRQMCAYEVRGFSGHWMIFSFLPFAYFAFVEPRQRESDGRDLASVDRRFEAS